MTYLDHKDFMIEFLITLIYVFVIVQMLVLIQSLDIFGI